jgi:dephospho-CoA kinase
MLHVGLTGNIASGKSAVAARLAAHGARVLDADTFAREAVAPGTSGLAAVAERFGSSVIAADGSLDRAALGRLVFRDAAARADLERIVHPEVATRRAAALADARRDGVSIVVSDVPLLFETGLDRECDLVIVVDAPEPVRLERLVRLRGMAEEDARAVMATQGDPAAKRARADLVINNDGSLADLDDRVRAAWDAVTARARRP